VHADGAPAVGAVPPPFGGESRGSGAGYYCWDSNETNPWAPDYSWRYPVHRMGWRGDDTFWTTTLPFKVTFCGVTHQAGENIYVGANGIVGFAAQGMDDPINQNIPNSATPNAVMAVLWDNLHGYAAGDIAVDLAGSAPSRSLFITYSPWYYYGAPADPIEFQLVIRETDVEGINNTIDFRYKDVVGDSWRDYGLSATVGLENAAGSAAAKYSYNQPDIMNRLAIRFVDVVFVDNQVGPFHLIVPEDGYVANVGEWIDFRWQQPEYDGYGEVTYRLYIDKDPNFGNPKIYDTGTSPSFRYVFGYDEAGTYWWKVRAEESVLGLTRWSEETRKLIVSDVAVTPTTWGRIKAEF